VLGFWDIQWADQGTLDFIEHVLGWARSSPILVLAEARSELFDRRPDWGRSQRSATLVHLGPLAEEDMRRLLLGLVPDLPPEPMRRIVDRAEGVPLYAVETLRMLLDRGVLEATGSHFRLAGELPELVVPETLHALIAARLDALPPEERSLLTDGSVLGLSFTLPSLVAVARQPEGAVTSLIEALVRRELLILDVDPRSPERGQYRFLQGVVREIAYQSLAKKNRQAKHLAAARYFESLDEEDLAGVRAAHYLAAFQATPAGAEANALASQARVALRAAADRATALHDLLGALASLEQALLVTPDPVERSSLHERALVVGGDAAQFEKALDHAEQAVQLYEQLGDRLGIVRTRARQASVHHMEHHDQLAIATLQGLLADAADLGPTPEIAHAQTELARALMLSGSSRDAVAWCDRVLDHPEVAAPDVQLEALITKGTALTNEGRVVEAEALLRGSIAIADTASNLPAGLRARNNLRVLTQWTNLREALALAYEVRDIALRFGVRAWVLHGISSSQDVTFRLGEWVPFDEETRALMVDAGEFYSAWFELEEHRRAVYRDDPREAERHFDLSLLKPVIANSAQAITWNMAAKADALIAQGKFEEAFAAANQARATSSEDELALLAGLFAAVGAGDSGRVAQVRADMVARGGERVPAGRGYLAIADSLSAALEGRWADSRTAMLAAEPILEGVGEGLVLARFRLALGHLAAGQFEEATAAAEKAEVWFNELGAAAYVATYLRAAARAVGPNTGGEPLAPEAEPSTAVRSGG
jgi:tetratricopeptide (TPR) repeat protein